MVRLKARVTENPLCACGKKYQKGIYLYNKDEARVCMTCWAKIVDDKLAEYDAYNAYVAHKNAITE